MNELGHMAQEALYLVLIVSGPPIMLSLVAGLVVAVFQAATQVQEQTLSFVPKVILVFGFLAIGGPWVGGQLVRFATHVFDRFPALVR